MKLYKKITLELLENILTSDDRFICNSSLAAINLFLKNNNTHTRTLDEFHYKLGKQHAEKIKNPCQQVARIANKKNKTILISGRDMVAVHTYMRRHNIPHRYEPTINRHSYGYAKFLDRQYVFFDTGFAGTILLGLKAFKLIAQNTELFLLSHEMGDKDVLVSKIDRADVLCIEDLCPKPFLITRTMELDGFKYPAEENRIKESLTRLNSLQSYIKGACTV